MEKEDVILKPLNRNYMKLASSKDLQHLEVKQEEFGFTVWDKETKRWVLDGSDFLKSGEINFSHNENESTRIFPIYDPIHNSIRFIVKD